MRLIAIMTMMLAARAVPAWAQATAGAAWDEPGAVDAPGLSPALRSCLDGCVQAAQQCSAAAGALQGDDVTRIANLCAWNAKQCAERCAAAAATPTFGGAPARRPRIEPDDYDDDDTAANATFAELVSRWRQLDATRSAQADQVALQVVQQLVQALCESGALTDGGCVSGGRSAPSPSGARADGTSDRWLRAAPASSATGQCRSGWPPSVALRGGPPGKFHRMQTVTLCVPGAPCSGPTSATAGGVTFTLAAAIAEPSGLCVPAADDRGFYFTLRATNTTSTPVLLTVNTASLQTSVAIGWVLEGTTASGWSLSNNIVPGQLLAPGATQELVYGLDCARRDAEAWAGEFTLTAVPHEPDRQLRLVIGDATPTCPRPRPASTITATQGISIPVTGGTLTRIQ